jgi:hypothetical protein
MVTSLLVGLLSLMVVRAQDDPALGRIQKMVSRAPIMCGAFEQQKTLVGLKRPVRSSGRFCVVSESGVLWNTMLPFASTLRLSREEIVQSEGDRVKSRLSARQEPTVGVISDLLFSVLAGDFKRLQTDFRIEAAAETGTLWRVKLTPKNPKNRDLRRVIASIELRGNDYVRQITLAEASGDHTAISFTDISTGESALRPDELRAFGRGRGPGAFEF